MNHRQPRRPQHQPRIEPFWKGVGLIVIGSGVLWLSPWPTINALTLLAFLLVGMGVLYVVLYLNQ